jgi:outer membrane protein
VKHIVGIVVLIALMPWNAVAEQATQRLSLRDAITMALENNHLVKAAKFNADAARQGIAIAGSRYYPSLSFEENLTVSNAPTQTFMMKLDEARFTQNDFQINNLNHPSAWHDFRTAVTLHQPLFNPEIAPAREMATKVAEKETMGAETTRQEIAFLTFRLYLEVLNAGANFKAADLAMNDARENLRLASVRKNEGIGLRSDELRARTHLSSVEQRLITARNDLTLAKLRLASIIGLKEDVPFETNDAVTAVSATYSLEELTKTAQEGRNDLKQARAEVERSDAALKLARSAWLPTLDAVASYQLNAKDTPFSSDNDAWMAGVSLKWQIFDGFRRNREGDRAVANRSAAAEMLENGVKDIRFQVQESVLRQGEMAKRRDVARLAVQDAEETVRLLTKRYENSLSTLVELLDAQTALNQARAALVETETNYVLAGGRVLYTSGIFLKEMMK